MISSGTATSPPFRQSGDSVWPWWCPLLSHPFKPSLISACANGLRALPFPPLNFPIRFSQLQVVVRAPKRCPGQPETSGHGGEGRHADRRTRLRAFHRMLPGPDGLSRRMATEHDLVGRARKPPGNAAGLGGSVAEDIRDARADRTAPSAADARLVFTNDFVSVARNPSRGDTPLRREFPRTRASCPPGSEEGHPFRPGFEARRSRGVVLSLLPVSISSEG